MMQSTHNPRFATLSDNELSTLYVSTYQQRKSMLDTGADNEIDALDSELFWLDDELCARGLDLPI